MPVDESTQPLTPESLLTGKQVPLHVVLLATDIYSACLRASDPGGVHDDAPRDAVDFCFSENLILTIFVENLIRGAKKLIFLT